MFPSEIFLGDEFSTFGNILISSLNEFSLISSAWTRVVIYQFVVVLLLFFSRNELHSCNISDNSLAQYILWLVMSYIFMLTILAYLVSLSLC